VLGTAQFGMAYGVTNQHGKPSKADVFKVLECAWKNGIKRFDTAPGYGSEELLGEFSRANGLEREIIVLTKVSGLNNSQDFRAEIHRSLDLSLDRLRCRIHTIFLHDAEDSRFVLEDQEFFQELLKNYQIDDLGISVYEPSDVKSIATSGLELAYQFPYNVLDRRFEDIQMTLGKRYARSIFLQGLLVSSVLSKRNLPAYLESFQKKYHKKIEHLGLDPVELAVATATSSRHIDYVLIGVENSVQLNEILGCSLGSTLPASALSSLLDDHAVLVTDPRRWS
jgi:hypothetical protein